MPHISLNVNFHPTNSHEVTTITIPVTISEPIENSSVNTVSQSFYDTFMNSQSMDLSLIWTHIKFTDAYIRLLQCIAPWDVISVNQHLSADIIREFQNKLNWDCISKYQTLSESFIREFQNKL